jgi:hypothetical protein
LGTRGHGSEQLAHMNLEGIGKLIENTSRNVLLAALNSPHIRPINACEQSKPLLRLTAFDPQPA